jgi:hypothetical protein
MRHEAKPQFKWVCMSDPESSQIPAPPAPSAPAAPRAAREPGKSAAAQKFVAALRTRLRDIFLADWDLGRIGVAIAVPVLCWVFYTTSSGMIDIMQKETGDVVGIFGTLVATSAVLVMLTSTSWSLGSDLAALIARRRMARERMVVKTGVTALVFIFVFSISAFFSFTYYYNNIFKLSSRRIVAELQPMELAAEIVLPTAKQIAARYDEASLRLLSTPSFRAYSESLDALLDAAHKNAGDLRAAVRREQEARAAVADEAARQVAAELQEAQNAARQIEENAAKIAAFEKNAADADAILRAKQAEIAQLSSELRQEEQLALDASKGLDGLGAACGPNCLSHRGKASAAQRRIATIRETMVGPQQERARALRQRDLLAGESVTLKHKAEGAGAAARTPIARPDASVDVATLARELTLLRDQLRSDPDWEKIRRAKPLCEPLLAAARKAKLVGDELLCEPAGADARELLGARDEALAARASFDKKCSLEGELRDRMTEIVAKMRAAGGEKEAAAKGFNEAKALVDNCVVAGRAAGLVDADVREFLKKSDAFLRGHSSERNKFELAREAFWSFTPDSTMAICVAMVQDAFVFIMKFLSEMFRRGFEARERRQFSAPIDLSDAETDAVDVRAMKSILRVARPVHGDMSEIDPDAPTLAPLPLNVRENLFAMLNRMVRDEIAHVDRRGFYVIDNATVAQVETRLSLSLRPRWSPRGRFGADGRLADAPADGPRSYYGDQAGEARRRRPSALERYLIPTDLGEDAAET